jgi:hypothetical protein
MLFLVPQIGRTINLTDGSHLGVVARNKRIARFRLALVLDIDNLLCQLLQFLGKSLIFKQLRIQHPLTSAIAPRCRLS